METTIFVKGCIGIMENKMETTILGLGFKVQSLRLYSVICG